MFEFITNPEDRGQVGIGTLIVFIAMVLVAAIAAGVLINTAGFLQTQAEATGQESTDLVSERIDVTSEVGIVGDQSSGVLDEIRLSVSGAPGADQIDLTETTIQAVGPGGQQNLVFTSSASGASEETQLSVPQLDAGQNSFVVDVKYDNIDGIDASNSDQKLVVSHSDGPTVDVTGSNLDGTQIDLSGGSGGDGSLSTSLAQGDSVTVELADKSGNTIVGPVTQTVDPIQLEVADVSDTDDTATINFNYNNIESIVDSDSSQELVVEFEASASSSTDTQTTVVASDINGGSVDITASSSSGNTNIDTSAGTAGQFSSGDKIKITLTDSNDDTVGSATEIVGTTNTGRIIQNTAAEVTAVFNQKVANLGPNEFAVGSDGNFESTAVLNEQKDFTILINPDNGALQDTEENPTEAFGESDSATLDIVSPSGATTSVELRAPDLFNENGEAVRL